MSLFTPAERVEYAAKMLDSWIAELEDARTRGGNLVGGKPSIDMIMEQSADVAAMATAHVNVAMAQLSIEAMAEQP
jgi:hypothetical protein